MQVLQGFEDLSNIPCTLLIRVAIDLGHVLLYSALLAILENNALVDVIFDVIDHLNYVKVLEPSLLR